MAANMRIFPASLARTVAQAVAAGAVGAKGQAGCAVIATTIGASWRLRLRRAGSTVLDMTFQAAMAPAAGVITLPAPTTLLALVDADIATPVYAGAISDSGWVLRIGRSDDTVYVEGSVGPAGSAAPFKLTNSLATSRGIVIGPSMVLRFDPAIDSQSDWLQLLRDSMAVQSVTERFTSGDDAGRIIGSDGTPVPFPDSYAGYVSHAGIQASLEGRSTGLSGEVSSYTGAPGIVAPRAIASPNILHFARGVDAGAIWSWWSTKTGHSAPLSRLRVSDMFFGLMSESNRTWQRLFSGMRVSGVRYKSLFGQAVYGAGEDFATDPNATYLTIPNGYNIEAWCATTASNPGSYQNFFGRINRTAFADSRTWVIGVKVRVEGPDRAGARFIGTVGMDHHRSDYYGDGSRYWPSGYPAYVADSGGGEWKNIRNDGVDQWVVAIGCFELSRFRGNRPPWGSWGGVWPFSAAPTYGPSWAEILANPPPDYRAG